MRKLALTVALVAVMGTAALAQHPGSLGLYTDQTASDCDQTFVGFVPTPIYLMYFRGDTGPDGIHAVEFKLEFNSSVILFTDLELPPNANTIGTLDNGLAIALEPCQGVGATYVWVATITAVPLDVSAPFTVRVGQSDAVPNPRIAGHPQVAICPWPRTIVGVWGGYYSHPDGTCSVAAETSSWGAIKEMFRR